ncbi:MAG TPA: hypothetical protein VMP86_03965 [Candidatus Binatia bacterium]|nr:hypothetical protein [Candidatus Binatia bacterium]
MPTHQRTRQLVALAGGTAVIVALGVLAMLGAGRPIESSTTTPETTIVAGEPGGAVISTRPSRTVAATPDESPTPAPVAAGTPAPPPPTPAPTPQPTPQPTAAVVAVAQPDDAVAAFYRNVAGGNFDAAYDLWSDRMKATYPRAENLDGRFSETASITFHQLYVAEQAGPNATVQANFTETYDSGATRDFIGYWELVRVNGRWLLDAPHY